MSKLKIRVYGDPCLRRRSVPLDDIGPRERQLIAAMFDLMYEKKGIGLAAPQVGENIRLFVADVGQGPMVVINPQIIKRYGLEPLEEGCLSIPGVTVEVKRPQRILAQYTDENNKLVIRELVDLAARVFLHETDHLNGKMIVDYANLSQKIKLNKQLAAISKDGKAAERDI